jgi:sulfatase maturation enzyme AslB (radical SAM superfamily)
MSTSPETSFGSVALHHLDQLWFQVAGTLCNLTCQHCFISCSPSNDHYGFLSLETIKQHLEQSLTLGVKEYYFTGGEPFLNREMVPILCETLKYGPASVLTNGTVFKQQWLEKLREAEQQSLYSLEFRVSIDGFSPETNDPIRGKGTFTRALRGIVQLVDFGFLPIITATRTRSDQDDARVTSDFVQMLKDAGYSRPRLKILPTLQLGAEEERTHGYHQSERVTQQMLVDFDESQLLCHHARIVTDKGVHVCPLLIESPDSLLGPDLQSADRPFETKHGACFTCYQYGAICANPSSGSFEQQAAKEPK